MEYNFKLNPNIALNMLSLFYSGGFTKHAGQLHSGPVLFDCVDGCGFPLCTASHDKQHETSQ